MTSLSFDSVGFAYGPAKAMRVFDNFSWALPQGRTVLLGPNGAGKSTLIGLGANLLSPNRGSVRLGELDPARDGSKPAYRRAVGWMPQQIRAVPGLSAREQVAYAAWLKGHGRSAAWRDAIRALEEVGLVALADRSASDLSGGELRRVGLAQALVHECQLLLLDEPTVGLDPGQRARFRQLLAELSTSRTILVSTHQVDDLSQLFDTVAVVDSGKIIFQGAVGEFLALAPDAPRPAEAAYSRIVDGAS